MYRDLTGEKFGRLTVEREVSPRIISGHSVRYWLCKCECGNELEVRGTALTGKKRPTISCGCFTKEQSRTRYRDLTGQRFGMLTVISKADFDKQGKNIPNMWICRCDCGKEVTVPSTKLGNKSYSQISCGCYTKLAVSKAAKETMKKRYSNIVISYCIAGVEHKIPINDIVVKNDIYNKIESKEIKYCIYKATNKINNKVYIGRTKNLKRRIKMHAKDIEDGLIFHNALIDFGIENFVFEAVDQASDFKEIVAKEIYWMKKFNSTNTDFGYNVSDEYTVKANRVIQLDLSGKYLNTYGSSLEASRKTGAKNISVCLNKEFKSCNGFMWVTEEFYRNLPNNYHYVKKSRQYRAKQSDNE